MSRGEGNIKGRDGVICYLPWMPLAFRFIDCDDWGVSLYFSTHVNVIWGPHSVSGFANSHFKPTGFYSRY